LGGLLEVVVVPFNGLLSGQPWKVGTRKVNHSVMKQEMMGWQWHQLDHMQIAFHSKQTHQHHINEILKAVCSSCQSAEGREDYDYYNYYYDNRFVWDYLGEPVPER